MYNISKNIRDRFLQNAVVKKAYISIVPLADEEPIIIDESNRLQTLDIEDYIYGDSLIGGTVAKKCTVKFLNLDSEFELENREIDIFLGIEMENESFEYIPFGRYIIQKPPVNKTVVSYTTIEALDYMIKFNIDYKDTLTYPCTIKDVYLSICEQCVVSYVEQDITNGDYVIENNQFTSGEKCRDVLRAISQISGDCAHIGRDNKLYLKFPTRALVYSEVSGEIIEIIDAEVGTENSIIKIEGNSTQATSTANKNLFDKNRAIVGAFIDRNTGGLTAFATAYFSDYILVNSSTSYKFSGTEQPTNTPFAWYTDAKVYISGGLNVTNALTSPSNAKYIRFTINSSAGLPTVQLEQGTVATSYVAFNPESPSVTYPSVINNAINTKNNDFSTSLWQIINTGLGYPVDGTGNVTINSSTTTSANITTTTTYKGVRSDYFPIVAGKTYTVKAILNSISAGLRFFVTTYNSSKTRLTTIGSSIGVNWLNARTFTATENGFITVAFASTVATTNMICNSITLLNETDNILTLTSSNGVNTNNYPITLPNYAELPKLTNGTEDTIEIIDNVINYVKRVSRTILVGSGSITDAKTDGFYMCDSGPSGNLTGTTFNMPIGGIYANIYYELATPVYTPIILPNIQTYKDYTAITSLSNPKANLTIKYLEELEEIDNNQYFEYEPNLQFGPVNRIVLRNSQVEGENVTLSDDDSIATNGLTELVISDNPFAYSQTKRTELIKNLFNKINGFKYLPFSFKYITRPYIDPFDMIATKDMQGNINNTYLFNHKISYNGGLSGAIETIAPTKTETAYTFEPTIKQSVKRTELKVDKALGEITSIVEVQDEQTQKITNITQNIDSISNKVSAIYDFTKTISSKEQVYLEDALDTNILNLTLNAENTVSAIYPSETLYPSSTLYPKLGGSTLTLVISKSDRYIDTPVIYPDTDLYPESDLYPASDSSMRKEFVFNLSEPLKRYDNIQDKFVIEFDYKKGTCIAKILRRIKLEGSVYTIYDTAHEEILQELDFELFKGTNYVYVKEYETWQIDATYIFNTELNKYYATRVEANTNIKQTADSINLEVSKKVGNDEIISKINQTAEEIKINAGKISLEGATTINGAFKVNNDGTVEMGTEGQVKVNEYGIVLADGKEMIGGKGILSVFQYPITYSDKDRETWSDMGFADDYQGIFPKVRCRIYDICT